jgi:hypothetical protein
MRGEVVSKASARLGVPTAEFEMLIPKEMREHANTSPQIHPVQASAPRHDVAMLCLLALRDQEARDFLLGQDWRAVLAQTPDAELLARILESPIRPDDTASVNAFMTSLSADEEAVVSSWLLQKKPTNCLAVAKDWWTGLRQADLRRHLQAAKDRMKLPQLKPGEVVQLQKEILDLQEQLHDVPKFSSTRVLDV